MIPSIKKTGHHASETWSLESVGPVNRNCDLDFITCWPCDLGEVV